MNETPEFPFWDLNICVDFDLRDLKKMENIKKLNKIIFHNKNEDKALFLLEFKFSYFFLVADSGDHRGGATGPLHPPDGFRGV